MTPEERRTFVKRLEKAAFLNTQLERLTALLTPSAVLNDIGNKTFWVSHAGAARGGVGIPGRLLVSAINAYIIELDAGFESLMVQPTQEGE